MLVITLRNIILQQCVIIMYVRMITSDNGYKFLLLRIWKITYENMSMMKKLS